MRALFFAAIWDLFSYMLCNCKQVMLVDEIIVRSLVECLDDMSVSINQSIPFSVETCYYCGFLSIDA